MGMVDSRRENRVVGLSPGVLVTLADEVMGVEAADGSMVHRERLGYGVVGEVTAEGCVEVRWLSAGISSWVEAGDLCRAGQDARLVEVRRYDAHGNRSAEAYRVESGLGFRYNWVVEILHTKVIRAMSSHGGAWSFEINWVFERVTASWNEPPDDDHAEALAAAELGFGMLRGHSRQRNGLLAKLMSGRVFRVVGLR